MSNCVYDLKVRVQFIDYGDTEDIDVSDVKELPLRELFLLPYQVHFILLLY